MANKWDRKLGYYKLKFNNQVYGYRAFILNKHGALQVSPDRILDLVINEDISSVFPTGWAVIDNGGNALAQSIEETGDDIEAASYPIPTYAFNVDSRDTLIVDIFPTTDEQWKIKDEVIFPEFGHRLYYEFAIYDEEERVEQDGSKQKILYLRDVREQLLYETRPQWSTGDVVNFRPKESKMNINYAHVSDEFRQAYTGEAIRHFIRTSLPMMSHGFVSDWDRGATKTHYCTSPCHTAYDSLEYLLDKHISEGTKDNCILGLERSDLWFLRPLTKFFERAYDQTQEMFGSYMSDMFTCGGIGTRKTLNKKGSAIPEAGYAGLSNNSMIQRFDGLTNYALLNMSNSDSLSEIVSTIVHNYNNGDGQFNIDCRGNHIALIRKKFKELYVSPLAGEAPTPVFPIDEQKYLNHAVQHVYDSGSTQTNRLKSGVNKVLSKALAYMPGVEFSTDGWTFRQPGRFMLLLDPSAQPGSPFEKFFNGEWFITQVKHAFRFQYGQYNQQIACIKPHSHSMVVKDNAEDGIMMALE